MRRAHTTGFEVAVIALAVVAAAAVGWVGHRRGGNSRPPLRAVACATHRARVLCESYFCAWDRDVDECLELGLGTLQGKTSPAATAVGETTDAISAAGKGAPLPRARAEGQRDPLVWADTGSEVSLVDGRRRQQPNPDATAALQRVAAEAPACPRRPSYLEDAAAASATRARLAVMQGRFEALLRLAAQQSGSRRFVILTVASHAYRTALVNWLHAAIVTGGSNFLIVATDAQMHAFLVKRGVAHYFADGDADAVAADFGLTAKHGRLARIWAYRFAVLRALLAAGITVAQCDVDALFLRNPWPRITALPGDVVAQRGNFPFNIAKTWGATMCFGFIVYRATPATVAWFDLSFPRFLQTPDDQVSFQRALDMCTRVVWNHGHTWPETRELHRSLKPRGVAKGNRSKVDVGVTEKPITRNGTRLVIALLPFDAFPRRCGKEVGNPERQPRCLLAHCVTPKSGSSKVLDSKRRGLHFLRDGWESELPRAGETTEPFVRRLGNGVHPMSATPLREGKPAAADAAQILRPIPKGRKR